MMVLRFICSLGMLAGILTAFISLLYLKNGLPECFTSMNQPSRPLKEYYRTPGYLLWIGGVGLIVIGWLGDMIIKSRTDPEYLAWLPMDFIIIGVGIFEVLISLFWLQREPTISGAADNTGLLYRLKSRFRGPGFRLARVGAATAILGACASVLIRIV